ncbi:MAG: hypothetical protein Q7R35_20220 [Elusimicrobiota bacterium]|nr:hypothetical protein [Elusimicrobiota bacterium]
MQDPKNDKRSGEYGFEKAVEPIHGIIERVHALEHPDWHQKDEDISLIKTTLSRYASELEHLKYRYDVRGAELEKIKAQYTELEHKFLMRPEAMRRAGEMEVTELVKKKHDLAALEVSLEKAGIELGLEKERLAAGVKELASARLAELEREYAGKAELLSSREEKAALREKAVSEAEKNLKAQIEEERKSAVEELVASSAHERAVSEGAFRKEKTILAAECGKWRLKAEDSQAQLAGAKKAVEELEDALESSKEAAAEIRQKCKLAEMENAAFFKRLEEWDKKGPELEKWRSELAAREEKCARIEENARTEAQPLRERIAALEDGLRQEKHEAAKWRAKAEDSLAQLTGARKTAEDLESAAETLNAEIAEARQKCKLAEMEKSASLKRLEEWHKKGPEFEKWRLELAAREEKCARLEENSRTEAQPLRERIAVLEDGLRQEKHDAEKWRLKAEDLLAQLAAARKSAEGLESAAESSNEAIAEARQKCKLAEMEKSACLERLAEWDKKGPELEKWRSELAAREQKCARLEENARAQAQPLRERIAAQEVLLRESEQNAALAITRCEAEIPEIEAQLKEESARAASLRAELKSAKEHLDKVLKENAALEENLVLATEKHLKAEAQKDAERSRKMESMLAGIEEKERELEEVWTRRHTALEAEQKGYHAEFEKRHLALLEDLRARSAGIDSLYAQKEAKLIELHKRFIDEFQDREAGARAVEEELRVKAATVAASTAELAREYEAKSSELETVKRKMLAEVAGLRTQGTK